MVFRVGVAPGQWLQLDDVVVTDRTMPDGEVVRLSGLVTEIRAVHEGARFGSDVFLIADGLLPAADLRGGRGDDHPHRARDVRAAAAGHAGAPGRRRRARHRPVLRPHGGQAARSGSAATASRSTPTSSSSTAPRGAHVNISGISGVATKTSYATFLLYSLFRSGVLGAEAANTKALVFNVKGEDLLFLDQPNIRLTDDDRDALRAPRAAGRAVRQRGRATPRPAGSDPQRRARRVEPRAAACTPSTGRSRSSAPSSCCRSCSPTPRTSASSTRWWCTTSPPSWRATASRSATTARGPSTAPTLRTYEDLVDLVVDRVTDEDDRARVGRAGRRHGHHQRLHPPAAVVAAPAWRPLVRADVARRPVHRISTSDAQVTVVDLHNLHDRAQRFVVGVTLQKAFEDKEQRGSPRPLTFVVLDELNKYAPARGQLADQGDPARRGRAGPQPRHDPGRRPADGQRGRAAGHRQLGAAGRRPARRRRGGPARVRLPARGPPPAGHDRQAGHDVREPARDPRAAGDRVPVPGVGHAPVGDHVGAGPRRPRPPTTSSTGCSRCGSSTPPTGTWARCSRASTACPSSAPCWPRSSASPPTRRSTWWSSRATCSSRRHRRPRPSGSPSRRCWRCGPPAPTWWSIAGNHDNADAFEAVRPVFAAAGITVLGRPCPPDAGGVVRARRRPHGRAGAAGAAAVHVAARHRAGRRPVRRRRRRRQRPLRRAPGAGRRPASPPGFDAGAVNVLVAHGTVTGARFGGGEREAQSIFDYHVPADVFPATALLRRPRPPPPHAGGAGPLPGVVLGLARSPSTSARRRPSPSVLVVDAAPGAPARVRRGRAAARRGGCAP